MKTTKAQRDQWRNNLVTVRAGSGMAGQLLDDIDRQSRALDSLAAENAGLREALKRFQRLRYPTSEGNEGDGERLDARKAIDAANAALASPNARAERMVKVVEAANRFVDVFDRFMECDGDASGSFGTELDQVARPALVDAVHALRALDEKGGG
jgi:hypothetical protein